MSPAIQAIIDQLKTLDTAENEAALAHVGRYVVGQLAKAVPATPGGIAVHMAETFILGQADAILARMEAAGTVPVTPQ